MAEQEHAAVLRARIDDASLVIQRPASGDWSALENVRHLLFAEQLHLGRLLPGGQTWSPIGLTPHFVAGQAAFRDVGTKPTEDVDEVLGAWDAVHTATAALLSDANEQVCRELQGNLNHLLFHVRIIESLLRESASESG
jgi:hypothetical protein